MDKIAPGIADAEDCCTGSPAGAEYFDDGFDEKSQRSLRVLRVAPRRGTLNEAMKSATGVTVRSCPSSSWRLLGFLMPAIFMASCYQAEFRFAIEQTGIVRRIERVIFFAAPEADGILIRASALTLFPASTIPVRHLGGLPAAVLLAPLVSAASMLLLRLSFALRRLRRLASHEKIALPRMALEVWVEALVFAAQGIAYRATSFRALAARRMSERRGRKTSLDWQGSASRRNRRCDTLGTESPRVLQIAPMCVRISTQAVFNF